MTCPELERAGESSGSPQGEVFHPEIRGSRGSSRTCCLRTVTPAASLRSPSRSLRRDWGVALSGRLRSAVKKSWGPHGLVSTPCERGVRFQSQPISWAAEKVAGGSCCASVRRQRRPLAGTAQLCSGCRTRGRSLAAPRSSGALTGAVGLWASAAAQGTPRSLVPCGAVFPALKIWLVPKVPQSPLEYVQG